MAKKPNLRLVPPHRPVAVNPREWIGGRIPTSIPVGDIEGNCGPDVVMWVELPSGDVLRSRLVRPGEDPGALCEVLLSVFEHPENETPGRVRVATESDAALIRPLLPPVVPIRVAPTPELHEVVGELEKALRSGWMDASYFDDGRLSEATLAKIFRAARDLYRRAPWKTAFDSHVLRLDVPELGVDGACLSILGALGETLGFVLFDSFADYEAFTEATDAREESMEEDDPDFGAPWMVLTYEPASDLPEQMRREVKEHRWLLAGPRAYPLFRNHSRDGSSGTLDERETLLMAVAADALATFARTHPAAFTDFDLEMPDFPELVMQHHGDGLPACTVAFPFESPAGFLHHTPAGPRSTNATKPQQRNTTPKATASGSPRPTSENPRPGAPSEPPPGRNDPCPCGSGKKYKKCHASGDAEQHRTNSTTEWMHDLDRALVHQMANFAMDVFPVEWARLESDPGLPLPPPMLEPQWVCYHVAIQGRTIAEWFVDRVGKGLQPRERAWIQSQRESWLSVWEVTGVDPGRSLTLRDLLTGTERTVVERGASRDLGRRAVILCRVVDHDGLSVLCGLHPHPLEPLAAETVVEAARRKLRLRRDVPPARLRDEGIGRRLLDAWDDACLGLHRSAPRVPDVFSKNSLRAMEDLQPPEGAASFESPQAVVRAFKERHYGDWENHALPAFGGRTPKQMCATKQGRAAVDLLLKQMKREEESEPAETRYDFSALRRRLGFGD